MTIKILQPGNEVITVNDKFIAVKRNDGTVDLIPVYADGFFLRIDSEHIIKIGYGDNIVESDDIGCRVITF